MLLQLTNYSQTECYSNAALAVILGNPLLSSYLSNVNTNSELITEVRALALASPNTIQSGRSVRSALVRAVPGAAQFANYTREEDSHEFLTWLLDGIERQLPGNLRTNLVSMFRLSFFTFKINLSLLFLS